MAAGVHVVKPAVLVAFFLAISLFASPRAMGTAPVQRTLNGCVAEGTFYNITIDARTGKPVKAYPMREEGGPDIAPYEGKKLPMTRSFQ